ncbi:hypothetical protein C3L33_19406, partial [Rhododendron williamsianum]
METMSPLESLDAFVVSASRAFCSPLAIFIRSRFGYFICLLLAFGWACAAYVRNREIRQMKDSMRHGNSFAFLSHDMNELEHTNQPYFMIIEMQITSLYGGPLEFMFVVESTEDPAYYAVKRLLADYKDYVDAKIIVAGLSTTCSQKIHNQLIGVERMHKDSKYVLFLDDDVRLHPGSIGALTVEMEKNPKIFIQTGYPLDLPSGSLGSYCIYEYHMMHANDFRNDHHGVVSGLRDGGYSDDMTLAAIAGAHKRLITSPPVAVFPHPLASDLSFSRYWNYLRKQTFVLESYTTKVNWIMNRALFTTHCYLSWGFVAPYCLAIVHVAAALIIYSKEYSLEDTTFTSCGLLLAGGQAICTFIELLSMWNLTRIEVQLCNLLSPEAPPLSLASYNWCLVSVFCFLLNIAEIVYTKYLLRCWWITFYTLSLQSFSFFSVHRLVWHSIPLKDGKISTVCSKHCFCSIISIDRSKVKGPKFTDLGGKHLYGKKGTSPRASIVSALLRSLAHWRQPKKFDG